MNIKEQLTKIALKKVKLSNGKTLEKTLEREAKRLRKCIQYYIDAWYNGYEPSIYERTGAYKQALKVEDIADIRIKDNAIELSLYFDEDLAFQESLGVVYHEIHGIEHEFDIGVHDSFVPQLMEFGWYAPKLEWLLGHEVPLLTRFRGIHAVKKGIKRFNKNNTLGIEIILPDSLKEH